MLVLDRFHSQPSAVNQNSSHPTALPQDLLCLTPAQKGRDRVNVVFLRRYVNSPGVDFMTTSALCFRVYRVPETVDISRIKQMCVF